MSVLEDTQLALFLTYVFNAKGEMGKEIFASCYVPGCVHSHVQKVFYFLEVESDTEEIIWRKVARNNYILPFQVDEWVNDFYCLFYT